MEGRELDAVPVYFADVEVFADFGDVGCWEVYELVREPVIARRGGQQVD